MGFPFPGVHRAGGKNFRKPVGFFPAGHLLWVEGVVCLCRAALSRIPANPFKSIMKFPRRNLSTAVMVLALSPALGQAGIISYSWNFYGTVPTNSTSFAGVVSAANWNDSYTISTSANPLSGSPWSNLIDDSGTATTLDISFNSGAQWQLNPRNVAPSQDLDGTYNKRMLKGYVDMSGGQPVTVTLAEIPYAKYDIYIYMNSAAANREGYVTDGASKFYFRTYGSDAISGDNAVFARATETTDLAPNSAANYAKFFNLSGSSQILTVFAAGNGGIAGIQVVEVTSPENNGIWTGGAGNWSETANWSGGTVAQGADRSATFNGASPATATIDSDFPIGSLLFSGADHTIAAGAGTLYLQGAQPSISVGTGRTATIASSLLGSDGLEKTSTGTLILSGSNGVTGPTSLLGGSLIYQSGYASASHLIDIGSTLEMQVAFGEQNSATTTFTGGGTLRKTGSGKLIWRRGVANFALDPDALIDVREGTMVAGSDANEVWSGNLSDLNVEDGATFTTVEANVRVNKITGSGTIGTGLNGAGYQKLTIGVAGGSSTFDGAITNTDNTPAFVGNLVKEGTGTITLAGINTYSGNTTVSDGQLEIAATGSLRFRPTTNGVNNAVSGSGSGTLSFLGTVSLNLTNANTTIGNSWTLFNLGSFSAPPVLTPTAVTSTTLGSFTEVTTGVWELPVTGAKWVFTEADGKLAYLSAASDYDTWKSANSVTGTEDQDDDNDGLSNFDEYAFGLDPTGGSEVNPIVSQLNKATGQLSYTRRLQSKTGLTYTVRSSTTLATNEWADLVKDTDYTESVSPSGDIETVTITLTPAPTTAKLFIQVRAD
jgi:autotransporter-associated beta strand protein